MAYVPTVTVTYGGPYSAEIELIQSTVKATPGFSAWDTVFPSGLSQGALDWINANENPSNFPELAGEDTPGPVTSADPQTTVDPVQQMVSENPRPY